MYLFVLFLSGDVEVPPPTPVDPKGVLAAKHSYSVGVGNQRVTEVVKEVIDDQHFSLGKRVLCWVGGWFLTIEL